MVESRKNTPTTIDTGTPAAGAPFDAASATQADPAPIHLKLLEASQTNGSQGTKEPESNGSVVADFFQSIGHAAIQAPVSAGAEVIDKIFHTNLESRTQIGFLQVSQAPEGSANYWAQQIGGSVGMLLPFLAAGKCVRGLTRAGLSEADLAVTLSQRQVLGLTTKEAFLTGFANDALFRPTDGNDKRPFLVARALNGVAGGVNMMALSKFSEPFMPSPMKGMEGSRLVPLLKNNITAGIISGVPAGIIGAQTQSYLSHLDFSSAANLLRSGTTDATFAGYEAMKQSALSSAVIGGVLGGYHEFKGQYATPADYAGKPPGRQARGAYPDMAIMEAGVGSQGVDAPAAPAAGAVKADGAKLSLDLNAGAKLKMAGHNWRVKALPGEIDANLHLVQGREKTLPNENFQRVKALNGVEEFVPEQTYKLWRTGQPDPEDGWVYKSGTTFKKEDANSKTVAPEEFPYLFSQNPDAFRLGGFKIGDRIKAPESDPGQVAGFDGSDLLVYHPARLGTQADVRISPNWNHYHEVAIGDELSLYRHNNGKIYSVEARSELPGKLFATPHPEYAAYPAQGPMAPERPVDQFKVGDQLAGGYGMKGYFAGYDRETGEAIVYWDPGEFGSDRSSKEVGNLDAYRAVPVQDTTLYRDPSGDFFTAAPDGKGGFKVTTADEYKAKPPESIRLAEIEKPLPLVQQKPVDVRPNVADEARPKIPVAPRLPTWIEAHYPTLESYAQTGLKVNGEPVAATANGQPWDLMKGEVTIGRGRDEQVKISDGQVSRNHGSLKWVPEEQIFYFADHSHAGTFVKRAGTDNYTYVHGSESEPRGVFVAPGDEIHLSRPDGPQVQLFAPNWEAVNRSATRAGDTQIFFDSKPLPVVNGEVVVGRDYQAMNNDAFDALNRRISREHAKLSFDGKNWLLQDMTDGGRRDDADQRRTVMMHAAGGNGTYVVRDGQDIFVRGESIVIQPNDKIHLGSRDGPELKIISNAGEELADGRTRARRENNETVFNRPDGTTSTTDIFNNQRIEDASGRILSVTDQYSIHAQTRTYSYAPGTSELRSITFPDQSVVKSEDGKTWYRTTKDGATPEPWWQGKIEMERDGSLKYSDGFKPPRVTIERLDGSREVVDKNGRVDYQNIDFGREVQLMNKIGDSYEIPAQRVRFKALMNDFEVRAKADNLSLPEEANAFHQIRRILQGDVGSYLPFAERSKLAEQLLYQAAYPQSIDQGSNNTCNVTTVEKRIFARQPSEAIRLVADVALSGKYVTAGGTLVDLSRVPGILQPDSQAKQLERAFDPGNRDIKIDEARSRASQIFEMTAVNMKYAREYKTSRSDVVIYQKDNSGLKGQEKERLVKYGIGADGRLTSKQLDDSPDMGLSDLRSAHNQITGGDEQGFIISGPQLKAKNSDEILDAAKYYRNSTEVSVAKDSTELQNMLLSLQAERRMPAIIFVDAGHKFFGGAGGGSGESGHVINVQRIVPGKGGAYTVEFTNQWGAKHNGTLTVDQLFELTKPAIHKKGLLW